MHTLRRLGYAALILAASVSLYALSGCASQQQEAAPPPEGGSALQPTEPPLPPPQAEPAQPQPEESAAQTTAVPEDFPLPIYAGMRVNKTLRTQTGDFKGIQVELVGDASPQAVADFYEAEFKKRNLNVSKMNQKTAAGEEILISGAVRDHHGGRLRNARAEPNARGAFLERKTETVRRQLCRPTLMATPDWARAASSSG
jgi:hypothetical protein